ncbi:MAG: ribosome biogenesis GTP-binding protein YihA/YsxC [bacterium]|nr:ribosome biogenesis GTP-binding protein YihA/YsxC [bacterium]
MILKPETPPFQAKFIASIVGQELPETMARLPELAIGGRSNVGKSSLLNALCQRKELARVSKTPGRTRALNYFLVEKEDFYLVDLPGYGYAKASKEEQSQWRLVVDQYLASGEDVRGIVVLVDGVVGPSQLDIEFVEWLQDSGRKFLIAITKVDKGTQSERQKVRNLVNQLSNGAPVIATSSASGFGIEKLREAIRKLVMGVG